jgi:hypothetical protein
MNSQSKTAAPLLTNLKRFLLNLGTPTRGLSFAFSARLSHPSIDASILAWRTSAARAAEGRQPAEGLLLIWKLWRRTDIAVLHRHGAQMVDSAAASSSSNRRRVAAVVTRGRGGASGGSGGGGIGEASGGGGGRGRREGGHCARHSCR